MKFIFLTLTISCCLLQGIAQSSPQKEKVHFSSINTFGIMAGSSGEGATVQSINGIRYKHWNFGVGTGIDWYGVRSIPLLADIRRSFTNKTSKPFVYANGGVSFPWQDGYGYNIGFSSIETNYKPSFYGEFGLGYKVSFKNQTALVISAGFSYKEIKVEQTSYTGVPGFVKSTTLSEYYYRRIAIRVGFSF